MTGSALHTVLRIPTSKLYCIYFCGGDVGSGGSGGSGRLVYKYLSNKKFISFSAGLFSFSFFFLTILKCLCPWDFLTECHPCGIIFKIEILLILNQCLEKLGIWKQEFIWKMRWKLKWVWNVCETCSWNSHFFVLSKQ